MLDHYRLMHEQGYHRRVGDDLVKIAPENTFNGFDVKRFVYSIRGIIRATKSKTILDYGSGKGQQYSEELTRDGNVLATSLHDFWNVREITCYDPAINCQFLSPKIRFDGVIATNVIDLIPEEDLPWVVDILFERAEKFVFCNVAGFRAPFNLPSGENARVVRKSKRWWVTLFKRANERYPGRSHCLAFEETRKTFEGQKKKATSYIHNCPGLILPGPKVRISSAIEKSQ
ncbi:hypothetical protein [Sneathiella sp.]|uniref:hypothetical protein n=1 Tax=Sneathiella sp. TaxID=1964365 RepID=UPI0039E3D940